MLKEILWLLAGYLAIIGLVRVVAVLVAVSFALSFVCNYLPGISALSDGTRTILLTVAISCAAAVLFPHRQEEAEQ